MVVAAIAFTQGALSSSAGQALIGVKGAAVTCSNGDNTGVVSRIWTLKSVPIGSSLVAGTTATTSTFSFTPDADHCYLVRLVVTGASGDVAIDERVFGVQDVDGKLVPAFQGSGNAHNFTGNARGWSGSGTVKMLDWMLVNCTLPTGAVNQHLECNSSNEWVATNVLTIPVGDESNHAIIKSVDGSKFQLQSTENFTIYPDNRPTVESGAGANGSYIDIWSPSGGSSLSGAGGAGGHAYLESGSGGSGTTTGGEGGWVYINTCEGGDGDVTGGMGGTVYIEAEEGGSGGTTGGAAGEIWIDAYKGGDGGTTGGAGGNIYMITGTGGNGAVTGGAAGAIVISTNGGGRVGTSSPPVKAPAGDIDILAGLSDSYAEYISSGGNITIRSSGGGPVSGTINLQGGKNISPVDASSSVAGAINITGGNCTHGEGGGAYIHGGNATYVNGGGFTGDLYGGNVELKGGDITGTTRTGFSAGGSIWLEGGAGHEGYGGDVIIQPGSGSSAHGAVYLITESGGTSTVYLTASILEATPAGFRTNEITGKLEYRHRGGAWTELP